MKQFVHKFSKFINEHDDHDFQDEWAGQEDDLQERAKKLPIYKELMEIGCVDITTDIVKSNEAFKFVMPYMQYHVSKGGTVKVRSLATFHGSQMSQPESFKVFLNEKSGFPSAQASSTERNISLSKYVDEKDEELRGYATGFVAVLNYIKTSLVDAAHHEPTPKSLEKRRGLFNDSLLTNTEKYLKIANSYALYIKACLKHPEVLNATLGSMGNRSKTYFLEQISKSNPGENMKRYLMKSGTGSSEYDEIIDLII